MNRDELLEKLRALPRFRMTNSTADGVVVDAAELAALIRAAEASTDPSAGRVEELEAEHADCAAVLQAERERAGSCCDDANRAQARVEELEAEVKKLREDFHLAWGRVQALQERIRVLDGALRQYGDHTMECDGRLLCAPSRPCDCGFDAMLTPPRPAQSGPTPAT